MMQTILEEHHAIRVAQTGGQPPTNINLTSTPDDVAAMMHGLHIGEASSTFSDRPLSNQNIVERWFQALVKKETARKAFEAAQEEFDGNAHGIIKIIGQPTYQHFYAMYLAALTKQIARR